MVQPKGWGNVKPYYWCDCKETRAVQDHLWHHLIHHPENGIYIKGVEKSRPESIEINTIIGSQLVNINTNMQDVDLLLQTVESIRLVMEDAVIALCTYTYRSEEHFTKYNTYNLQYKWQQLDKKSKHLDH